MIDDAGIFEGTAVVEMPVDTIRPAQAELGAPDQGLVEPRDLGTAAQFSGEGVAVDRAAEVAEGPLGVPDVEAELRPGNAFPGRTPVVVGPVPGSGVDVDEQIVDEVVDVEDLEGGPVVGGIRHVAAHDGPHVVPGIGVTFAHFAELGDHVPPVVTTVPRAHEVVVDALGRVVIALVVPVDEEVDEVAPGADVSGVDLQAAHQFVHDKRIRVIVHSGAEGDAIEFPHFRSLEPGKLEGGRAVVAAEVEAEGVLREGESTVRVVAAAHVVAALDPQSTVDLHAAIVVRPDQFGRNRPFPGDAALGGVARVYLLDPGGAPEVAVVGDERDHRQGADG